MGVSGLSNMADQAASRSFGSVSSVVFVKSFDEIYGKKGHGTPPYRAFPWIAQSMGTETAG